MTRERTTRIALTTVRVTMLVTAMSTSMIATPAFAASTVDVAAAALSFWMTWGLVYLGIGVALLVIAATAAVRERRAWSSLLSWSTGPEGEAPPDGGIDVEKVSIRAA